MVKEPSKMEVQIILGNPGAQCAGHGICFVYPRRWLGRFKHVCPAVDAKLVFSNNYLSLVISKQSVQMANLEHHFNSDMFKVETAHQFLGCFNAFFQKKKMTIPIGNYPIKKDTMSFTIEIRLNS